MALVDQVRNIVTRPAQAWPAIATEPGNASAVYSNYVAPLAAIGPIATFIGLSVIGISIPFIGTYRVPLVHGIVQAIVGYVFVLLGVFVAGLIINALAPMFSGQQDALAALKVAAYSSTPAFVAGILGIFPPLALLQLLAGLYSIYVLYLGLPVLMKSPKEKAPGYTALTVVCTIVVGVVLTGVLTALRISPLGGGYPRAMPDPSSQAQSEALGKQVAAKILGAAAGGGAENEQHAADVVNSAVDAAKGAAQPGAGTGTGEADKDAAKGVAAAGAMIGALVSGGKKRVEPIDYHALKSLLPDSLGSLKRQNAEAEKSSVGGITGSKASASYSDNEGHSISVSIGDLANASGLLALGAMAMSGSEHESDTGFEKNVEVGGHKVHEEWTAPSKTSALTEMVGDRFVIEVKGSGVEFGDAEKALGSIDVDKLQMLAPSGR
jgi:hypothetical protein